MQQHFTSNSWNPCSFYPSLDDAWADVCLAFFLVSSFSSLQQNFPHKINKNDTIQAFSAHVYVCVDVYVIAYHEYMRIFFLHLTVKFALKSIHK